MKIVRDSDFMSILLPLDLFDNEAFCRLSAMAAALLIELGRQASFMPNGMFSLYCDLDGPEAATKLASFLLYVNELNASGLATWVQSEPAALSDDGALLVTFWAVDWLPYAPLEYVL